MALFYSHSESNLAVWFSYVAVIWDIFPVMVCLDQEKSGNPAYGQVNLYLGLRLTVK
jgi:hypothetical protein